ncbi:hypothetical protein ACIQVK_28995 [Streptomyces sp. NPDC090493]|uniref:hypothetical protein n=1 Tax=Streptomyces sp. NPDC090493 TaxID=3365964 RepID=UPI003821925D
MGASLTSRFRARPTLLLLAVTGAAFVLAALRDALSLRRLERYVRADRRNSAGVADGGRGVADYAAARREPGDTPAALSGAVRGVAGTVTTGTGAARTQVRPTGPRAATSS